MIVGNDGGVAISFDQGGNYLRAEQRFRSASSTTSASTWRCPIASAAVRRTTIPGAAPSRRRNGPITNAMWFSISGGDGFVTQNDPTDPNIVYSESQGGNIGRLDLSTGVANAVGQAAVAAAV